MKFVLINILLLIISSYLTAREIGETEITAEEGIEVFQDEKYYLLKKNVKILSDNFVLSGDLVKIYFDQDLYDIKNINAIGKVNLIANNQEIEAKGEKINFTIDNEEITVQGFNSILILRTTEMLSDGKIIVNNTSGSFSVNGANSSLKTENISITGNNIAGIFESNDQVSDIYKLEVNDENIAYVDTNNNEMFANIIKYNKEISLIELEKNVKIISDGETITGDYATIDTKNNSYKIRSDNSKKVRVLISNNNE